MVASLDDVTKKFEGFNQVMQHVLDKVSGLES